MVATTGAGESQVEGLKVFFDAQVHRKAADLGFRFSLPPYALDIVITVFFSRGGLA
jgi:hypothetical protein